MSTLRSNTPDDIRLFKWSIIRWTLTAAGPLLLVAAVIGERAVTLGFLFGLCVGFINFDLMTRFNAALLGGGGSRAAVFGTLVRLGLIFAGGVGVWWKEWSFIAAGVGCFLVYPVLLAHGLLLGRHKTTASAETKS
jgi:hypothetical protein